MKYVNPPIDAPVNVLHRVFYSGILGKYVGYNIYIPEGYSETDRRYPVEYHLHGWMGDESSDVRTLERLCRSREMITVFPNNSPNIEGADELPMEDVVIRELIPHIDGTYRTLPDRENRKISGFSMGGGYAFVWAVRHTELFSGVTAYAGTYHHYYHPDYETVGIDAGKAAELYLAMTGEGKLGTGRYGPVNVIDLVNRRRNAICGRLEICLHIGTADVLYCDNEIMRLHLETLGIPHEYVRFDGADHTLAGIL